MPFGVVFELAGMVELAGIVELAGMIGPAGTGELAGMVELAVTNTYGDACCLMAIVCCRCYFSNCIKSLKSLLKPLDITVSNI